MRTHVLFTPILVALFGCPGEQVATVEPQPEPATEVPSEPVSDASVLINFPADCTNVTAIGPAAGESNHLAAALLGPGTWPYRVDTVKVALSNEPQEDLACDASLAHTVHVWVLSSNEMRPPVDRPPDRVLEFDAVDAFDDPARLLQRTLDPPIELTAGENLAIALQFAGTYPDSSCITACNTSPTEDVDFWSNASAPPYSWTFLSDFGIGSNLWIFAEGEAL